MTVGSALIFSSRLRTSFRTSRVFDRALMIDFSPRSISRAIEI